MKTLADTKREIIKKLSDRRFPESLLDRVDKKRSLDDRGKLLEKQAIINEKYFFALELSTALDQAWEDFKEVVKMEKIVDDYDDPEIPENTEIFDNGHNRVIDELNQKIKDYEQST